MAEREASCVVILYHFSEDPHISRFEPRAPLARPEIAPLVWAIDGWHAAMYYLPRECPRACFWCDDATTADDRERWCTGPAARMVIAVETRWLDRIRRATLYRYTMPAATFEPNDATAGHFVSRVGVSPLGVEPVGDLLAAIAAADVELRIMPSLRELWERVIASSLQFSGTRLSNAHDRDRWGV